ncbi:MAG: adenylate cyclase [Psychromonas sp.]|jgi:adenylate cyclase
MERYLNILVVESKVDLHDAIRQAVTISGSILLFASSLEEAEFHLKNKEIGIVFTRPSEEGQTHRISQLKSYEKIKKAFYIAYSDQIFTSNETIKILQRGYVDILTYPIDNGLVAQKIKLFKDLFLKNRRIQNLLENIFPIAILDRLTISQKYSPKKVNQGVVLFSDFVDFSRISKHLTPMEIVKKLDSFFLQFDAICDEFKIEKIKTIGDAYMGIAGVTEGLPHPKIRACLAALAIRDFISDFNKTKKDKEPWQIRVGINSGPLVAGIIGSKKMSFDVWGDAVNIASRAEQSSDTGKITITQEIVEGCQEYFNLSPRGKVRIKKRGGEINMFFLKEIKEEYAAVNNLKRANTELREHCGLTSIDFVTLRKDILNRLNENLSKDLTYHSVNHAIDVEKSAIRIAELEGITGNELILLRTAAIYHDAGFLIQFNNNEVKAVKLLEVSLPLYGYNKNDIQLVKELIISTKSLTLAETRLQKILSDADHDYFGRADYYSLAGKLRNELATQNIIFDEREWLEYQLNYLDGVHFYFTEVAKSIRLPGKKRRIKELTEALKKLNDNENLH